MSSPQLQTTLTQPTLIHVTTVPGALRPLRGQLAHMRKQGYRVIATASPEPLLDEIGASEKIEVRPIKMAREIAPIQDLISLFQLMFLFLKLRPTIVHSHTPKAGMLAMIAAFVVRVPVRVYHIRGLRFVTIKGWKRTLLKTCEQIACGLAHHTLCVSHSVRQVALDNHLTSPNRIHTLLQGSHGIDAEQHFNPAHLPPQTRQETREHWNIPQEATVVGFVGRLVNDKGIREFHSAWNQLKEDFPELHLLIVGFFEEGDPLPHELRQALEQEPRIHLTGKQFDTPPLFAAMDILCLPTYREGLPFVTLEAAAMNLPVVATDIPGCIDAVIHEQTGLLVNVADADSLAAGLRRYLASPELRQQHAQAGRQRVLKDFRPRDMWQATADFYQELTRTRRLRSFYACYGKRLFDMVVAATALVVLTPALGILLLLIRWKLGSPVFFKQDRPGKDKHLFKMVKFRSMTDERDEQGKLLPDEKRLPRFGQLLRSSSLDELPELWNVLKGDMSLVGPRPLLARYLSRYTHEQARRHHVRPGITGWAQVNGRNNLSWEEKFQLDVWYTEKLSFWLDLKILWMTIWKTIRRESVQTEGHATAPEFMGSSAPKEQSRAA